MSSDDQGGAGRREVAYRAFAAEYEDADLSYSESDEERAPNYVVLPTGARVNRVFVVGVLTEVERASEEVLRARIVDPTGAFVVYAGQYQPDALAFLDRAEPPAFVALTGKARTFQPEDSSRTYTSIRPETANEVDADTRDRWTVAAARQTVERVGAAARALTYDGRGDALRDRLESEGLDAGLAAGIPLALDHYGTTATYLDAVQTVALQAAAVVVGDRDEVDSLDVRPDDVGSVEPTSLVPVDRDLSGGAGPAAATGADGTPAATSDGAESGAARNDAGVESSAAEGRAATAGSTGVTADDGSSTGHEGPSTGQDGDLDVGVSEVDGGADAGPSEVDGGADAGPSEVDGGADAGEGGLDDFEPGEFELDEDEREEIEREYGTDFQSGAEVDDPGEADIDAPTPDDESGTPTGPGDEVAAETGGVSGAGTAPGDPGSTEPAGEEADTATDSATDARGADATDATTADTATAEMESDAATATTSDTATEAGVAAESAAEPAPSDPEAGSGPEPGAVDVEEAVMEAMRAHDEGAGAARSDVVDAVVGDHGVSESEVDEAIQEALMDGRCYEPEDDVYKPI